MLKPRDASRRGNGHHRAGQTGCVPATHQAGPGEAGRRLSTRGKKLRGCLCREEDVDACDMETCYAWGGGGEVSKHEVGLSCGNAKLWLELPLLVSLHYTGYFASAAGLVPLTT